MVIDLNDLLSRRKSGISVHHTFSDEEVCAVKDYFSFYQPPEIHGRILNCEGKFLFEGVISTVLKGNCASCLEEIHIPLNIDAQVCILSDPQDVVTEYDTVLAESGQLDINDLCLSQIANEVPLRLVCKEDCKGLCQICGQPKESLCCTCGNEINNIDERMAKLQELLSSM